MDGTASAPTTPLTSTISGGNVTTPTVPAKSSLVTTVVSYLQSGPFLHVAGLTALSVLTGIGVVPVDTGLPLIVGAVGLGINTSTSKTA